MEDDWFDLHRIRGMFSDVELLLEKTIPTVSHTGCYELFQQLRAAATCCRDIQSEEWIQLGQCIFEAVSGCWEMVYCDLQRFSPSGQMNTCRFHAWVAALDAMLITVLYFASTGSSVTSTTPGRTDAVIIWDRFEFTREQLRSKCQVVTDAAKTEKDMAFGATALLNRLMEALDRTMPGETLQEISAYNSRIYTASESSKYRTQSGTDEVNLNFKPFIGVPGSHDVQSLYTSHSSEVSICSVPLNVYTSPGQVAYFEMLADRELSRCQMASGGEQTNHSIGNNLANVFPKLLDLRSCHQDRAMGMQFMICWMAKQPQDGEDTSSNRWCNLQKPLSDIQ